MREIKFRVWDSIGQKWVSGYDVYMTSDGRFFGGDIINPPCNQFHEREVTFYTGLKDENGVEIYEGDIVRADGEYGDILTGEIYFKNGCFMLREHTLNQIDDVEVIGNIYENPELIE